MTNASTLSSYGPFVAPGTSGNVLTSDGAKWTSAAAASGSPGPRATVYTTAGSFTFTVPSGVTQIKVTVVGGGAGGQGQTCCAPNTAGGTGGTSSISSGTQTISTVSATGGAGGTGTTIGGLGSGGDINGSGGGSGFGVGTMFSASRTNTNGLAGAGGGGSGFSSAGGTAIKWFTGLTPGNTISVTVGAGGAGGSGSTVGKTGGPGVVVFEY